MSCAIFTQWIAHMPVLQQFVQEVAPSPTKKLLLDKLNELFYKKVLVREVRPPQQWVAPQLLKSTHFTTICPRGRALPDKKFAPTTTHVFLALSDSAIIVITINYAINEFMMGQLIIVI